jgi:hypothetical protein
MAVIAVCTTHTAGDLGEADIVCPGMAEVLEHLRAIVSGLRT